MTDSEKLDLLLEKMDAHDRRFDQIDQRFEKIDERFEKMDERLAKMDNRFEKLEDEVSSLGMILENEIRRNIGIVAEGHMDLVRKMNEVLSKTETIEQLSVRVGVLESRMLRVEKQRAIL
ncbi:MAG: hypothetical protein ACI4VM_06770 [Anaerovoracaceae bacterium]